MRARYLIPGMIAAIAACSAPAPETADESEPSSRELALRPASAETPVASDVEVHRPDARAPERASPMPPPDTDADPLPEPIGRPVTGEAAGMQMTPAPTPAHVHTADAAGAVEEPGGGKPRGVSTGLGPVPDRNWGDPTIIDDPSPFPDPLGGTGTIHTGRDGAVIIRGGMGGVDDDCVIHPRGGVEMPTSQPGGVLINERAPRTGGAISERAPRTISRPSLPRGGRSVSRGIRR